MTIKFRAFNKKTKVMYYNVEFLSESLIYRAKEFLEYTIVDKNGEAFTTEELSDCFGHLSSFGELLEDEDFVVMQDSGLKDKNGKEIYEGDILKYFVHWKEEESTMTVDSLQEWFEYKGYAETELGENWSKSEVVGNIYENSDLLK